MKKLFIEKNEEVASIVDRVLSVEDSEVVLVIPKDSTLRESLDNLAILKREADSGGKTLLIESVDPDILTEGAKAGIEGFHPLFRDTRTRSLSDIVPQGEEEYQKSLESSGRAKPTSMKKPPGRNLRVFEDGSETSSRPTVTATPAREELAAQPPQSQPPSLSRREVRDDDEGGGEKKRFLISFKGVLVVLGVIVAVGLGVWITNSFFGRADVVITFKNMAWKETVNVLATKSASAVSSTTLPAEVLTQPKNTVQFFPASGKAVVSQKATGKLTIYNAYSSVAQSLVATTRFSTPDGKIFRLDKAVIVPGASVKDGKITPSSIEADVSADKAGEAYNIGPVAKLTIPGFKDSPKFDGFYGEFKNKTSGGAVGERPVPTEADIIAAKEKTVQALKSNLENNLLNNRPEDLKIIDGASDFTVTRLVVNSTTDEKGQFSVLGEGQFRAVAFREGDIKALLLSMGAKDRADLVFRTLKIDYQNPNVDFTKGEVAFSVTGDGVLWPKLSEEELVSKLRGTNIAAARSFVLSLPDLEEGKISLWPIWLGSIPESKDKVKVTVQ